jgi:hypothetical protein
VGCGVGAHAVQDRDCAPGEIRLPVTVQPLQRHRQCAGRVRACRSHQNQLIGGLQSTGYLRGRWIGQCERVPGNYRVDELARVGRVAVLLVGGNDLKPSFPP